MHDCGDCKRRINELMKKFEDLETDVQTMTGVFNSLNDINFQKNIKRLAETFKSAGFLESEGEGLSQVKALALSMNELTKQLKKANVP